MPHVNRSALVDTLCERLAVESGAVDLYRAVLPKIEAKTQDRVIVARLERFMRDEMKHRDQLATYLQRLGDAAHETPSSRLAKLETQTMVKLVGEADTPDQLLNILLTFELMDETAWEMLINLGRDLGEDDMVHAFEQALSEEKEHLRGVRGLLAKELRQMMTMPDAPPPPKPAALDASAETEEIDDAAEADEAAEDAAADSDVVGAASGAEVSPDAFKI